jgi:RHS repeat-associated protein
LEVQNVYDSNNRVQTQTHADGGLFTFNYATGGGNITETTMTGPNGAQTTWGFYDHQTRITYLNGYMGYMITPDGTTVYDRALGTNLLNAVTDPLGRQTTYTYYPDGQKHTVTDNLGNPTTFEYEPVYGLLSKVTDANNKTVTLTPTYDSNNRIAQIDIRDQLAKLTTVFFNGFGMKTSVGDANNNVMQFYYDNAGKPAELTRLVDPLGNTRQYSYDALGRLTGLSDANGKATTFSYTLMDKIEGVTDPVGAATNYTYDGKGNLTGVLDAKGRATLFDYDTRDRISKMTDPLGRTEIYEYYTGEGITSATGDNLKSVTDRKGQKTTFQSYDAMSRPLQIAYQDGSSVQFTYDAGGRITGILDSLSGAIGYTYSGSGCSSCSSGAPDKIISETTPQGIINYTYDNLGRRQSMTLTGQPSVAYTYYDTGRLQDITQVINGTMQKFNLGYDDTGRRTSLGYYPGASTTPIMQSTYGYDNASRLLDMQHTNASALLEELKYEYDPNGNKTKFSRNITHPLPSAISNTSYNNANEMLTLGDKAMTYDANGNLLSVTDTCGTTNYMWDARNRLTEINGYKPDCSVLTALFQYDAVNRRTGVTVNGITTQYVYDGLDIIQEMQNGAITANYMRTLNIDEPLMRLKADGTMRLYKTDALGSIIGLTDENGILKTTYAYEPFGKVTITGEASDNPFQYTGRENDGTGLYYYRARYYDPQMQRFISADPIGLAGGVNLYAYVGNNPVNRIDPSGLAAIIPGWNGNYKPGFTKQTPGCDQPFSFLNPNACAKKCCDEHDDCYTKYGCNASSWFGNVVGNPGACQLCNAKAIKCILSSSGKKDCGCQK